MKWFAVIVGAVVAAAGASAGVKRLPEGYQWGRCLLVVEGFTRISGKCAYKIYNDGDFHIEGPRQIYAGIDYPKPEGMPGVRSADYWADVFKGDDGRWTGYGNREIAWTHADFGDFGPLRREGACFLGEKVRVCLWRK
jgi:hypothetical protein